MSQALQVTVGQHSDKGHKESNQDFHGVCIPVNPLLGTKGIAIALADGISSSEVSQIASQSAVTGFLEDYYCTSEAWSVKTSAERVLVAINSWLHAQTQQSQHRYDKDRGYVCTLSAVVLKSTTAHIFHIGDTRVYLRRGRTLEQLTEDHRVWISSEQSHLARALGIDRRLEIDYRTLDLQAGDCLLLATDGVYEYLRPEAMIASLDAHADDLDSAARQLIAAALANGSSDNLTLQLIRIDALPSPEANEMYRQLATLPLAPLLEPRSIFDGYQILHEIRGSSRSHIYLALDQESGQRVVIKTPSIDMQANPAGLERFLMEEWIARRINSAHVLKPCPIQRQRHYLYVASEFIEGQTLSQWMVDHPKPELTEVRRILSQVARGLQAFHRLEMIHQDLKPDNIMIETNGTVKIIDFGATRVAGVMEGSSPIEQINLLGAAAYAAPEYFLGENGSARSDLFSLGVIAYQMLSGRLPYGLDIPKSRTRAAQKKLVYQSVLHDERDIPAWIDHALCKAVQVDPMARHDELSEFIHDLHHPSRAFLNQTRPPLIERHPVGFWKGVALLLAIGLLLALGTRNGLC